MVNTARIGGRKLCLLGAAMLCWSARAVILLGTGDPEANTTAPVGELAGSGWQYMGNWGPFTGMPVSPDFVMTAKHLGGVPGQPFTLNGKIYPALQIFGDPSSDLELIRILGRFPDHATLYDGSGETGSSLVVFGRGSQRGASISPSAGQPGQGWLWGPNDSRLRWGQNSVTAIQTDDTGTYLRADFNGNGSANEAILSVGDSGGAVFISDGGIWKLAGVNSATDGPYNTTTEGSGFFAALFDVRGFYEQDQNQNWVSTGIGLFPKPASFYATRVSSRMPWIQETINQPLPADCSPVLESSSTANGTFQPETGQSYSQESLTIATPIPSTSRFYRLKSCAPLKLSPPITTGGVLRFSIGSAYPP